LAQAGKVPGSGILDICSKKLLYIILYSPIPFHSYDCMPVDIENEIRVAMITVGERTTNNKGGCA
jgi:hypothetical protein